MPGIKAPLIDRLTRNITINENGCWVWNGATKANGYGVIQRGGRSLGAARAHRLSYELHVGEIPHGFDVCHSCDNRLCINPEHLFVGTRSDNMVDASKKGRLAGLFKRKLTESEVVAIRASKESMEKIAKQYGTSTSNVYSIIKRKTWKHLHN